MKDSQIYLFSSDSSLKMYTFISSHLLIVSNWISKKYLHYLSTHNPFFLQTCFFSTLLCIRSEWHPHNPRIQTRNLGLTFACSLSLFITSCPVVRPVGSSSDSILSPFTSLHLYLHCHHSHLFPRSCPSALVSLHLRLSLHKPFATQQPHLGPFVNSHCP